MDDKWDDETEETELAAPGSVQCPFCGEPGEVEAEIDESEPGEHRFVQDCEVCCRPWAVRVAVDVDGEVTVSVDRA